MCRDHTYWAEGSWCAQCGNWVGFSSVGSLSIEGVPEINEPHRGTTFFY